MVKTSWLVELVVEAIDACPKPCAEVERWLGCPPGTLGKLVRSLNFRVLVTEMMGIAESRGYRVDVVKVNDRDLAESFHTQPIQAEYGDEPLQWFLDFSAEKTANNQLGKWISESISKPPSPLPASSEVLEMVGRSPAAKQAQLRRRKARHQFTGCF